MRAAPPVLLVVAAAVLILLAGAASASGTTGTFQFFANAGQHGLPVPVPKLLDNGQLALINASLDFQNATAFSLTIYYYAVTQNFKGELPPVTLTGEYQLQGLGEATTVFFSFEAGTCSQDPNAVVQLCALVPPMQSYVDGPWQFMAQPARDNTTYGIAIGNEASNFLGLPYVAEFICQAPGACPAIAPPVSIATSFNNQTGNVRKLLSLPIPCRCKPGPVKCDGFFCTQADMLCSGDCPK